MLPLNRQVGWLPRLILTSSQILFFALLSPYSHSAVVGPKPFAIPAADAEVTLEMFSDQSGAQLVYLIENVEGVMTNPVQGMFAPRDALERLVAHTELRVNMDEKTGTLVIARESDPRAPAKLLKQPNQAKPKQTMKNTPRNLIAAFTGWLVATTATFAQTATTPSTTPAAPKDEVLELSAFTVNAAEDTGYVASDTLAGTRLRTNLRDVAASISIVTKDFMNDIAANNLGDLLTYTAGTEVDGLAGNFSGSSFNSQGFQEFNNASRTTQSQARVRGLGNANQTRDYFLTDTPMDSYNVDRVEVNRGPNAILFGLGSPAGIINSGLIKGLPSRTKTKLEYQIDESSSQRFVLDHNQVLVKDVLAIRFAALLSDKRFEIEPAFIRDDRYFLTANWRPWKGGQLNVSAETAEQKSTRPYGTTPVDQFTWWLELGKPVYNPLTNIGSYLGTPSNNPALRPFDPVTGAVSPNAPNNPGFTSSTNRPGNLTGGFASGSSLNIVSEDPNSSRLGITGLDPSIVAIEFDNTRGRLTSTGAYANVGARRLGNSQEYLRQTNVDQPLLYGFWKDQRISDPNLFDFYHDMMEGRNKREWAFWDTRNASFSQEIGNNAGLEVAYDWQRLDSGYIQPLQFRNSAIAIDINTHLANGIPNPNLGRPMTQTALGFQASQYTERESFRATAYYKLDIAKGRTHWLAKLMGRHIFTGSSTNIDRENFGYSGRINTLGNDFQTAKLINSPADRPSVTSNPPLGNPNQVFNYGSNERTLVRTSYLGASLVNVTSLAGYTVPGVTALQNVDGASTLTALYYERPPNVTSPLPRPLGAYKTGTFSIVPAERYDLTNTTTGGTGVYEKTDSLAFVANSYWWDNTLVSTLGWRTDKNVSYRGPDTITNPEGGKILYGLDTVKATPASTFENSKFNYGLVLHIPPFLRGKLPFGADVSLTYNKSDNFAPSAQRYDIYGEAIAPPSGTTDEWSVLLSLFDNKLEMRATQFETSSAGQSANYLEIHNNLTRLIRDQVAIVRNTDFRAEVVALGRSAQLAAWDAWEQTPTAQNYFRLFNFNIPPGPYNATTPTVLADNARGDIVSVRDLVAKGYEIDLTYNPTKQWRISLNFAQLETINSNTGIPFRQLLNELAPVFNGTAGDLPRALNNPGNTLGPQYFSDVDVRAQGQELLDGALSPEVRRHRFNGVTNYTFKGGMLNNVRIGGAYRWQDKSAIGYPVIAGPGNLPLLDVKNPYYGDTETNVDAWIGYSRVFSKRKIKWNVQLNVKNIGKDNHLVAVSTQPNGVVDTYRIGVPQTWTLTNSFEF